MTIEIEIDDETFFGIEKRFDIINECAKAKCSLPDNFTKKPQYVYYYDRLRKLYEPCANENEVNKIDEKYSKRLKNMFVTYVGVEEHNALIYKQLHDMRMRTNALFDCLTKGIKKLSQKKTFCKLFELIGCLYDDETRGQQLKETAGYYIVTECKEHTDEEIEVLNKEWSVDE
ncbi:MAG: hypothetical protein NC122_10670 [Faecalibacterium sp.]|nr:hypothetical protein [Ruminococcus sp.]MCM1393181.1 hypothetical protein [Ruminococcus sp.]MCM1486653.1 hypothetical protein [Faecalibacterium sp.]